MNISLQGVFWSFVLVTLTLLGIVAIGAGRQEAQLNRLLDNSAALYETSCVFDAVTVGRVLKMANDQGFYGSFLEIYDTQAPANGDASLTLPAKLYRDRMYIELRYPTIATWAKITQMAGLRGSMPKSEKKVAFKYVICQKPTF
jgi:hypothetical protein